MDKLHGDLSTCGQLVADVADLDYTYYLVTLLRALDNTLSDLRMFTPSKFTSDTYGGEE